MKAAILILALVAITASVAYAAPEKNEDAELNALLNKILKENENELEGVEKQDDDDDDRAKNKQDQEADIEAFLETIMKQDRNKLENVEMQDDDDETEGALQELHAKEQVPAEIQRWFRRAVRRVGRFIRSGRANRLIRRAYRAYRCYRG